MKKNKLQKKLDKYSFFKKNSVKIYHGLINNLDAF